MPISTLLRDELVTTPVPDVFTHVAYDDFLTMWNAVKLPLLKGDSPESFFEMLARNGKSVAEVETIREAARPPLGCGGRRDRADGRCGGACPAGRRSRTRCISHIGAYFRQR